MTTLEAYRAHLREYPFARAPDMRGQAVYPGAFGAMPVVWRRVDEYPAPGYCGEVIAVRHERWGLTFPLTLDHEGRPSIEAEHAMYGVLEGIYLLLGTDDGDWPPPI